MEQIPIFRFDPFTLDSAQRRLLRAGEDVYLPPKTFEVLLYLLRNRGRVITKDELLEAVWPGVSVVENTLAQRIREIREALGDGTSGARFIKTLPRVGYQFIAPLDEGPHDAMAPPINAGSAAAEVQAVGLPGKAGTESVATSRGRFRQLVAIGCVTLAGMTAIGYHLAMRRADALVNPAARITSVAVLPFKPLDAEGRDVSLELGMADSLITKLGGLGQVTVRPLSAVRRYTDLEQDAVGAGRELRVESVLEGSIQRLQGRIRVRVRLVRVGDEEQLWTGQFDENWTDIFTAQDHISQRVARALALRLTSAEQQQLSKRYTENPDAWAAYVRGRYFWSQDTGEGFTKALEQFERAIDFDRGYALAFAGLADSYNLLGSYGLMPLRDSLPKARAAALKALELDDRLAEAHTSLGAIIASSDWNWPAAETHFRQAIRLSHNYETAHEWYSEYLSWMTRHEEAIREARLALDIDPASLRASSHVGLALYRARRYPEAVAQLQETLELDADFVDAHVMLGVTLLQTGMYEAAILEFQKALGLTGKNPDILSLLGYAYGMAGLTGKAHDVLAELDRLSRQDTHVSSFCKVPVYIGLNDKDHAFKWLDKSYTERLWFLTLLATDPMFDRLRADRRYAALLRKMNLPLASESHTVSAAQ